MLDSENRGPTLYTVNPIAIIAVQKSRTSPVTAPEARVALLSILRGYHPDARPESRPQPSSLPVGIIVGSLRELAEAARWVDRSAFGNETVSARPTKRF